MNIFKIFNKKKEIQKPLIIAIHGFGKRRTDEYIPFIEFFKDQYDIVTPELFDQRFKDDVIWHNWVSRAEEAVIKAKNDNREIILVGFSMGGVIASYLASKFNVKRLVLLAPAFEYLTITTAKGMVFPKKVEEVKEYIPLPNEFTSTFIDVVENCKKGIKTVTCPTIFIACMDDELIPYTASLKTFNKMNIKNKKCIILAGGEHRLLDNTDVNKVVLNLINDFLLAKFD